jgi:hypothetical protein
MTINFSNTGKLRLLLVIAVAFLIGAHVNFGLFDNKMFKELSPIGVGLLTTKSDAKIIS